MSTIWLIMYMVFEALTELRQISKFHLLLQVIFFSTSHNYRIAVRLFYFFFRFVGSYDIYCFLLSDSCIYTSKIPQVRCTQMSYEWMHISITIFPTVSGENYKYNIQLLSLLVFMGSRPNFTWRSGRKIFPAIVGTR